MSLGLAVGRWGFTTTFVATPASPPPAPFSRSDDAGKTPSTTPRYSSGCDEVEKCQEYRVIYRARRSRSSRGAFPSERTSRSSRSKFMGPRVLLRCSSFGWSASRSSWIRSGVLHSSMV